MTPLRRFASLALLALLVLPAANAQFLSELVGFNDNPDVETSREMFLIPEASGTTTNFIVHNTAGLFDFNRMVSARTQAQIGQVSFRKPCPDLLHATNNLGKADPMCEQVRDLPGACQIAKPEQAASRVQQAKADKLFNGSM